MFRFVEVMSPYPFPRSTGTTQGYTLVRRYFYKSKRHRMEKIDTHSHRHHKFDLNDVQTDCNEILKG